MSATDRRIEDRDALQAAVSELADAASRRIMLFVPDASDAAWSAPGVLAPLQRFATERRQREVAWLFAHVDALASDHAGLVTLSQRLPSLFPLRQADPDFALPAAQGFIANDAGGLLLLDSGERLAGTLAFAADRARPLASRFDEAWQRARPLSELRALGI